MGTVLMVTTCVTIRTVPMAAPASLKKLAFYADKIYN